MAVFVFQEKNLDWFPRMRAMSLAADDGEGEQNELRNLQQQLESTNKLVMALSQQLAELKEQVCIMVPIKKGEYISQIGTLHCVHNRGLITKSGLGKMF